MKVGFLIRDFQVFETEVQMIMDLIGRKVKIWVRISSGKYPHRIDFLPSDIAPDYKLQDHSSIFTIQLLVIFGLNAI